VEQSQVKEFFRATGRRKESSARVILIKGSGKILVNGQTLEVYFKRKTLEKILVQPLECTNTVSKFDITAEVIGGGIAGQADAIKLGIARALVQSDETLKKILRKGGFLTRDPREHERYKYGHAGRRKRFQFSKR